MEPKETPHPLEPSAGELRLLVDAALERIVAHVDSLPRQAVSDTAGGFETAQALAEPEPPREGAPLSELLDLFFDRALANTYNTASPGYLAFIPGGGLLHSAVADLIADATNRYSSVYAAAPAVAQIEANVLSWLCRIAGYPPEARGLLTSGG